MRRAFITAVPLLLLGWSTAPTEDRNERGDGRQAPAAVEALGHDEALRIDAAYIAAAEGQSEEAALRALTFQVEVGRLTNALPPDVIANSYAGGALTHFPAPRADLYFAEDVPAGIADHFTTAGLSGVELHGGMRYTLDELMDRTSAVRAAAGQMDFPQVTAGFDIPTQQITVEVVLPDAGPAIQGTALVDVIEANAAAQGVDLAEGDLKVVEHPAGTVLFEFTHGYGGAGVRDDGVRECTSAFVIRRPRDGTEGPLTAGHCEGINRIEENNASGGVNTTFSAPFVAEHIGSYGDVEWHTTVGHDDFPQFWSDHSQLRWVEWKAQPADYMLTAYVCKYGRVGGYGCGRITDPYDEIEVSWEECGCDILATNMVEVEMERCCVNVVERGDSGGPWFLATGAYGITSGGSGVDPRDGHQLAWFSRVANAEAVFAVTVQLR